MNLCSIAKLFAVLVLQQTDFKITNLKIPPQKQIESIHITRSNKSLLPLDKQIRNIISQRNEKK